MPKSFVTPVTPTYWRTSCKGGDTLSLYVRGWRFIDHNATPYVRVELKGCNGSGCETLLSEVVVLEPDPAFAPGFLVPDLIYEGGFKLSKSILGYEYLNFTITPIPHVMVLQLSAFASARCVFNYSLTQPALRVSIEKPYIYSLSYPAYVDYSGLVKGLTSSLAGLLLMVIGAYVKLYDVGERLGREAGQQPARREISL